jgi:hypothetical protein
LVDCAATGTDARVDVEADNCEVTDVARAGVGATAWVDVEVVARVGVGAIDRVDVEAAG